MHHQKTGENYNFLGHIITSHLLYNSYKSVSTLSHQYTHGASAFNKQLTYFPIDIILRAKIFFTLDLPELKQI